MQAADPSHFKLHARGRVHAIARGAGAEAEAGETRKGVQVHFGRFPGAVGVVHRQQPVGARVGSHLRR